MLAVLNEDKTLGLDLRYIGFLTFLSAGSVLLKLFRAKWSGWFIFQCIQRQVGFIV